MRRHTGILAVEVYRPLILAVCNNSYMQPFSDEFTEPVDVVDGVLAASRALVAVAAKSLGAAEEEVTLPQYRALVVLATRGPQRMTELADALEVNQSTVTRMC